VEPPSHYFRNGNIMAAMKKPGAALGQVPLTPAVFHVLLALADGPLHGYAIMQAVERSAGEELKMGPGTIYGSIQRMEDAGLLRELASRPGDRRRVFGLLPAGRRALEAEARRLTRLAALVRGKRLITGEA
jgi:DNA-binding PadR family transcriptional regulator